MSESIASDERLYRNLHPEEYDNGRIDSSAFNPSKAHKFRLSVDRSSMVSAQTSYEVYVGRGKLSAGVCSVLCEDFSLEAIPCTPAPEEDNPAHALADYGGHGTNQRKKKARLIARKAMENGLDHEP